MMKNNITSDIETSNETILVLGGTGKTGRRIVERLKAQGHSIRIVSRSGTPPFDWKDRSTWSAALEGIASVYISYCPDLAVPEAPDDIQHLVGLAAESGVNKLVLLSGRGEEEAQRCEQIVLACGIPSTVVRCSWFNQNFSENFLRDMVLDGTLALPVNGVREPFVDVEDIADVAVAALTEEGHEGEIYELTGPELLSFDSVASELSEVTGGEIRFQQIPHAEFMAGLRAAELPNDLTDLIGYLFSEVMDGRNESLSDGVQRALGRPPRRFADYARDTAAAGYWNQ